jgi:hypothetical protein
LPAVPAVLGTVLEHAEDRLSVGNVERHDPGFAVYAYALFLPTTVPVGAQAVVEGALLPLPSTSA